MNIVPTLGADMALRSFTAALYWGAQRFLKKEFSNNPAGFRALLRWLKAHCANQLRVGIESTNVYGEALAEALYAAGCQVHLLNPERVSHYAHCLGLRNKTDPVDAVTIAAFVATQEELTVWQPLSPEQKSLRSLTRARYQLVQTLGVLSNQLRTASGPGRLYLVHAQQALRRQLSQIGRQIAAFIRSVPALREAAQRMVTCKGIGLVTAATILAELPPIGPDSDPRAICSWAGLTPRRRQSGQLELPSRIGRAGNAYLRHALYMPALVAKRWNPCLAAFAARLKAKGKSTPAILGAISHKMLRILVGMLRSNSNFDPNWSPQKT
jgi:transposase